MFTTTAMFPTTTRGTISYDGAGQPMVVAFLELCFRFYKYHARKRTRTVAHSRTQTHTQSHTQLARAFKVGVLSPFMYKN